MREELEMECRREGFDWNLKNARLRSREGVFAPDQLVRLYTLTTSLEFEAECRGRDEQEGEAKMEFEKMDSNAGIPHAVQPGAEYIPRSRHA